MPAIRTFIALPTSPDVRQKMADIQSRFKETHADVKWDTPDKFHMTLKFLGSVDLSKLEMLKMHLEKAVGSFHAIDLDYNSIGTFPDLRSPRVVWIGAEPNNELSGLQSAVENVCSKQGFPAEDRAFHPHITLGRVKGTRNLVHLTEAIKTITFETIKFSCSNVLLMKSDLQPGGSIYSILSSFPLNL